ncbi:hypothetical protein EPH95_18540 [Salicibibacter halophilus]|uniref:Uncharacterized protein n=1 Tax=Salicibibacter halophilus TaxID=2502791 RepID=A0A514LMV8_9BACI|nr:hypothetical protein [Salicibibacter halophilus]QDI92915.1 hypothetical protein EPH95_18540 [Salicibibacter halophilus]
MTTGIIGTGNMGTMLAETLVTSRAVPEERLFCHNRNLQKVNVSVGNILVSTLHPMPPFSSSMRSYFCLRAAPQFLPFYR